MAPTLKIRPERPADVAAIDSLTIAAFADAGARACEESRILEALRSQGALSLSILAVDGDEIIGHAAFSPVRIAMAAEDWFGLGPVSVRPDRQGSGVGQAVVRGGLQRLVGMGAAGCVVLGAPAYYRRFGFAHDPRLRFGEAASPYFQRVVFRGSDPIGEVLYHPAFYGASPG
jgi:putative acetyltransferase